MMNSDNDTVDRRNVLKQVAAGATVVTGVSGVAGAETGGASYTMADHGRAVARYDSPEGVRNVVADHEDALESLAEDGFVEAETAAALTLRPQGEKRGAEHEHVTSIQRADGSVEPEIKITRMTDEGMLTFAIRPESDERWALLGERGTEPKVLDGATTLGVCEGGTCEKYCCDYADCCVPCICSPDPPCVEWCYDCNC